jgi:2-(1,2-epoxy-1,2-dihydrophenyl)acetyl-CoA isomerase
MPYELVKLERDGFVATITLNRPDKLNALNRQLTQEFHEALDEVAGEFPDIRAVILTGAGSGFCSGADVADQAAALSRPADQPAPAAGENGATASASGIPSLAPHIRRIPQPVIAAINGVAAGAGFSITLASDIRIASELARFSCIFVKRSLVPDTASSYTLASIVGMGTAMEMALTGRVYGSDWALQKGLVNYLVTPGELMAQARAIADEIAANPPICVRSIKQLMFEHGPALEDVLPMESRANGPSTGTQDRREAVLSFMERRQPVYYGR